MAWGNRSATALVLGLPHIEVLISHTANDILTSLTGVYSDRYGIPVANTFPEILVLEPHASGRRQPTKWAAYGVALECWFFHRPRSRTRNGAIGTAYTA